MLSKNICMFCTIGWASVVIFLFQFGMNIYDCDSFNDTLLVDFVIEFFKNTFFVWASSSIFYFFLKHNFE